MRGSNKAKSNNYDEIMQDQASMSKLPPCKFMRFTILDEKRTFSSDGFGPKLHGKEHSYHTQDLKFDVIEEENKYYDNFGNSYENLPSHFVSGCIPPLEGFDIPKDTFKDAPAHTPVAKTKNQPKIGTEEDRNSKGIN
jgi:hypothetical protein